MKSPLDRFTRFIDALLHERRPPRFSVDPEDAAALYAASALKAARPGADLPNPGFTRTLEARLREVVQAETRPRNGSARVSRRTALQVGGASAAAMVAGVLVDRALTRDPPPPPEALVAGAGRWVAVVSAAQLQPGHAVRFSTPGVEGFLVHHDGAVLAMSAVCTHMGCILRLNQPARRLDCPCHGASFSLDGAPIDREYLKALPRLPSRLRNGSIEVEVPAQA